MPRWSRSPARLALLVRHRWEPIASDGHPLLEDDDWIRLTEWAFTAPLDQLTGAPPSSASSA